MNKTMRNMAVALVALSAVGGAALAQQAMPPAPPGPPPVQLPSPTTKAMNLSEIVKKLEDGGYTVIRNIDRIRGHWFVRALDQAGEVRALVVDPISGAIAEAPPRAPRQAQMRQDRGRGGDQHQHQRGPMPPPRRT